MGCKSFYDFIAEFYGGARMTRADLAEQNFRRGLNCAQSVFLAFSDLTALDEKTALKIAAPLGGGVGRLREICGALSASALVAGLLFYDADHPTDAEKSALYAREQELASRFRAKCGAVVCRDLLAGVETTEGARAEERTDDYYRRRPCPRICRAAAAVLEEYLREQGILPAAPEKAERS